jgi:hypothetical protein
MRLAMITRLAYRGCLSLMVLCAIVQCRAQASAPVEPDLSVALSSLVHFTQWPNVRAALRICVVDMDEQAVAGLERAFAAAGADRRRVAVVTRSVIGSPAKALNDCQAIYFGSTAPSVYRPIVADLVGRPILTIGLGDEFCSVGGLFCIDAALTGARTKANFDSIASSGLHVNPQLLRLTQRTSKEPK